MSSNLNTAAAAYRPSVIFPFFNIRCSFVRNFSFRRTEWIMKWRNFVDLKRAVFDWSLKEKVLVPYRRHKRKADSLRCCITSFVLLQHNSTSLRSSSYVISTKIWKPFLRRICHSFTACIINFLSLRLISIFFCAQVSKRNVFYRTPIRRIFL